MSEGGGQAGRYWVRMTLGVGIFFACLITFCLKIVKLLETGSCASGGNYVIANECPEGTGLDIALLVGSMIGLFIAAGFVLAAGDRPGRTGPGSLILLHGWTTFFCVSGVVVLVAALTKDGIPSDSKFGGAGVGVVWLLMGLPALWISLGDVRGKFRDRDDRPKLGPQATRMAEQGFAKAIGAPVPARKPAGGGLQRGSSAEARLSQLERLQRLRDRGTLSEEEFAKEKRRILDG